MRSGNEIAKTIIKVIFITGGIAVASTSPYFFSRIIPKLIKYGFYKMKSKKDKKKIYDTFHRLNNAGLIKIDNRGGQIYISLTREGKKRAGKYQIDDLEIKRPKKWDGKWRILIFDVKNKDKLKREALRGKIKELGLSQLQKSVWVYPYDFRKEFQILRSFFEFTNREMQIITATEIEDDKEAKTHFNLI